MKISIFLDKINALVWGNGLLALLLFTGIFYTFKLKFIQFKLFPFFFRSLFEKKGNQSDNNGISQLKSVCASLGTAMGTGNIVGVSSALAIGGAGAVFWMWISAFLGMALVYSENVLSILYRKKNVDTLWSGPALYIEKGLGSRTLAVLFSIFCIAASFGMGGMVQANSISLFSAECINVNPLIIAAIIFICVLLVINGGIKRIGSASQIIIPILTAIYIIASCAVIFIFRQNIGSAFSNIFNGAFNFRSAIGGSSGFALSQAFSIGIRRGIFSNEAGLGSSPIMHGAAECDTPHIQGMWSIFEVFLDTIICCTLTALVLLTSNSDGYNINAAFSCVFGDFTNLFLLISISLFAFCTIIGWYYCGETSFKYIAGERHIKNYRIVFAAVSASGAIFTLNSVWTASDIFNGLMAFPNLVALILLSRNVKGYKT